MLICCSYLLPKLLGQICSCVICVNARDLLQVVSNKGCTSKKEFGVLSNSEMSKNHEHLCYLVPETVFSDV